MNVHEEAGRKPKDLRQSATPDPSLETAEWDAQTKRFLAGKPVPKGSEGGNLEQGWEELLVEVRAGSAPINLGKIQPTEASDVQREQLLSMQEEYRNYRTLVERTIEVFGDPLKASLWLSTPSVDLEGRIPMQVAQSVEYTASALDAIFEPIFIRIEHGIYT